MPAGGAQGAVMAYSWMDHRSGLDRRTPARDAYCSRSAVRRAAPGPAPQEGRRQVCRTRVAVRHRCVDAGRGHHVGFGPLGLLPMTLYGAPCWATYRNTPRRRSATTARREVMTSRPLFAWPQGADRRMVSARWAYSRLAWCERSSRDGHDRNALAGGVERNQDWFRPQGTCSRFGGP